MRAESPPYGPVLPQDVASLCSTVDGALESPDRPRNRNVRPCQTMPEMSQVPDPEEKLSQWVRSSLAHLYDTAYLQTHPLGTRLEGQTYTDHVTRSQNLRRRLLDSIEMLRPQDTQPQAAHASRAYAILTYRYVDGLSMDEIADKLSLSRRQAYREHEKGIEAIASWLSDQYPAQVDTLVAPATPNTTNIITAEGEVERLRRTSTLDTLSVEALLKSVIELLKPLAAEMNHALVLQMQAPLPQIKGERVQMRQALINILTQAIEVATSDILIDASRSDTEFLLAVDVAGADSLPCDEGVQTQSDMPCIELAVARALVEAQGGQMALDTEVGFHVRVRLPAVVDMASLLVIDDNADMVTLFRRFLGGHQVSVVGVSDSDRALQLSADLQPQLITLDVMMPHLDGWDVLQQIKSRPSTQHIPVIVCSVLNEAKLAQVMGASGYLTKPVNQTDFLAMTQRWLGPLVSA